MIIAGDTIEQAFSLNDNSLVVKDSERGILVYPPPRPASQLTSKEWREIAERLLNGNRATAASDSDD